MHQDVEYDFEADLTRTGERSVHKITRFFLVYSSD